MDYVTWTGVTVYGGGAYLSIGPVPCLIVCSYMVMSKCHANVHVQVLGAGTSC